MLILLFCILLCVVSPAKCHDSPSNKFYGEAESWEPNDCTVCVCRNGTPECLATVCRHPDCKEPLYIKGQCCPVCPLVDPSSSGHNEAGNNTSHSLIFQVNSFNIFIVLSYVNKKGASHLQGKLEGDGLSKVT